MGLVLVLSAHCEEINAGGLCCWSQEKPWKLPAAGMDQHHSSLIHESHRAWRREMFQSLVFYA